MVPDDVGSCATNLGASASLDARAEFGAIWYRFDFA